MLRRTRSSSLGILDGGDPGPRRDSVLTNAGACLVVAAFATTLSEGDLPARAREQIESGAALAKLSALRQLSS